MPNMKSNAHRYGLNPLVGVNMQFGQQITTATVPNVDYAVVAAAHDGLI